MHRISKHFIAPILGFAFLVVGGLAVSSAAEVPSAITLLYFQAIGRDGSVLLEWATATEFETVGFWLDRSLTENGPYQRLTNIGFIPSAGGGIGGAEYSAVDDTVTNGTTYWYKLIEVESNGTENAADPVSVIPGPATPTATPSVTSTPTATNQPGVTLSATASATATSAGNGSQGSSTSTETPTASGGSGGQGTETATSQNPATKSPSATTNPTDDGASPPATPTFQSIAQVPTPTGAAGYPSLPTPTLILPPEAANAGQNAYLGPEATSQEGTSPVTAAAYPAQSLDSRVTPRVNVLPTRPSANVSGSQVSGSAPTDPSEPDEGISGTIFLWLGFLAALLVFAAGLFGSIVIFTRRKANQE